jgi:hypothetical protein
MISGYNVVRQRSIILQPKLLLDDTELEGRIFAEVGSYLAIDNSALLESRRG